MNVFGKYFEFDGISSDDYNITLLSFEEVDNERETGILYDLNVGEITPLRPIPNFYNKKYSKPLQFKITIAKACDTNQIFTIDEQRKIIRWLTSPIDYRRFRIMDFDDDFYHCGIEYFCICTNYQETVVNNLLVGMTFTFQCNAPYGFYKEEIIPFNVSSSTSITIENYSDERESVYYPSIIITGTATGTIIIHNNRMPKNDMELHICKGQTLYIDTNLCDINDDLGKFKYSTDTNLKWIGLLPGKNILTISGAATGEIHCRYPRKVGI